MLSTLALAFSLLAGASERPTVAVSFYPLEYLAKRIGGDLVEVVCPVPEGADPIFWRPTRDDVRVFQDADLILLNGARFERWAELADLPMAKTVRTARGFRDRWIEHEHGITHSHGDQGEHTHKGIDGHTWLDPLLMIAQAEAVGEALKRLVPERTEAIDRRLEQVAADLRDLDAAARGLGALPEGQGLVASHPAYNYFARRYGIPVVNLDLDPGEAPSEEQLERARHEIEESGLRCAWLLWEAAPDEAVARAVERALGLESLLFEPCETLDEARRKRGEDYLTVMRANVERLKAAFPVSEKGGGDG